jgi:hypothetical protein
VGEGGGGGATGRGGGLLYRIQNTKNRIHNTEYRIQNTELHTIDKLFLTCIYDVSVLKKNIEKP